ncbi:hypothetical protein I3760_12G003700 [Carya illinoinensis]|nr:hypothetical protein I3760_12G003700 [Carya illinoinensis]
MALLDLIHKFLNVVALPFTFFSLCLLLPPYSFFKLFLYFFNFIFSEDFARKVVLITGASSGIGEVRARLSLAARRESSLREVVDRALDYGSPDVLMIPGDVSNVEDCARIVEETINHSGRLDHLVNNAGINSVCMFEEATDITAFRTIMDTNFWGSAYTIRFTLAYLRESRGKWPTPRMSFYNSEMTQGKFLLKEGKMQEVDQDLRDVQLSAIPVETAGACAAAIVKSACRGDRYLTEPAWFKVIYFWKVFFPEVIEWCYRLMYMNSSPQEAPSKKILDLTGAKNILHPSTLHTSEIKTD